jgi:hypothetical protein
MYELLQPGRYAYRIVFSDVQYVSNAGNLSIKLVLKIDHEGKEFKIFEYLTKKLNADTGLPYDFIVKKTKDLLTSINKPFLIDKDLSNEDLLDGCGYAVIKTDAPKGDYGPSNRVARFLPPSETDNSKIPIFPSIPSEASLQKMAPVQLDLPKTLIDDDIPF